MNNVWNVLDELAERAKPITPKQNNMDIIDDVLTMSFDVPGLSKSDITIKVEDRVITLEGENDNRTFNKQYKLNEDWDINQADASVKNGVLTLSIPKMKEKKKKVLEIIVK
jgi:HSP20 family molecular chaperone IbpA